MDHLDEIDEIAENKPDSDEQILAAARQKASLQKAKKQNEEKKADAKSGAKKEEKNPETSLFGNEKNQSEGDDDNWD